MKIQQVLLNSYTPVRRSGGCSSYKLPELPNLTDLKTRIVTCHIPPHILAGDSKQLWAGGSIHKIDNRTEWLNHPKIISMGRVLSVDVQYDYSYNFSLVSDIALSPLLWSDRLDLKIRIGKFTERVNLFSIPLYFHGILLVPHLYYSFSYTEVYRDIIELTIVTHQRDIISGLDIR